MQIVVQSGSFACSASVVGSVCTVIMSSLLLPHTLAQRPRLIPETQAVAALHTHRFSLFAAYLRSNNDIGSVADKLLT